MMTVAEFSGEDGIVEVSVEAMSQEEGEAVRETVVEAILEEHGFEQYR